MCITLLDKPTEGVMNLIPVFCGYFLLKSWSIILSKESFFCRNTNEMWITGVIAMISKNANLTSMSWFIVSNWSLLFDMLCKMNYLYYILYTYIFNIYKVFKYNKNTVLWKIWAWQNLGQNQSPNGFSQICWKKNC